MASNANLRKAKKAKNDEFYTQWSDIEKEIMLQMFYRFLKKIIGGCDR